MTLRISYAKGHDPITVSTGEELDSELDRIAAEFAASPYAPPLVALQAPAGERTMLAGLRGRVGVLNYVDPAGDAGGLVSKGAHPGTATPPYFYDGSWTGFEDNAEIPIDHVRAAAREFLTTGERPTCVDWHD